MAVGRADRLRRRVHRMARIRLARPEHLHDGGNAAPGAQLLRGLRLHSCRHDAGPDAAVDGALPAARRQRSEPADLHRGLAAEGRQPVRTGAIALADLTAAPHRLIWISLAAWLPPAEGGRSVA